jgi:hypothetical protein
MGRYVMFNDADKYFTFGNTAFEGITTIYFNGKIAEFTIIDGKYNKTTRHLTAEG